MALVAAVEAASCPHVVQPRPLGKLTWGFAIAFLVTSISLTIISAKNSADSSVVDALGLEAPAAEGETAPAVPDVSNLLPPVNTDDSLTPPRAD